MKKVKQFRIVLSILVTAAAGFCLKYFGWDTYIILLGFRFHLSFLLPFLLILPIDFVHTLKRIFLSPVYRLKLLPLLWVVLSYGIIFLPLFSLDKIQIADPQYFYEFGISSIFDYPIYLLWNSPQLILQFIYLSLISSNFKIKFFPVFLSIIFLFSFEVLPVEIEKINYINLVDLIIAGILAGLFFQFYRNVYWFVILFFSLFWINYLSFGSSSAEIINILFASHYDSWEGFFTADKIFKLYLFSAQMILLIITMLLSLPYRSTFKQCEEQSAVDVSF